MGPLIRWLLSICILSHKMDYNNLVDNWHWKSKLLTGRWSTNHEMRKHDNAMLGHPDMFWFDTRGLMGTHGEWHMGTLEAVELGHAREVTRLGHPDICYHEITNPNINLVHFSLQPKNLKCTSLAIQCTSAKTSF